MRRVRRHGRLGPLRVARVAAAGVALGRLARGARQMPPLQPTAHDPQVGIVSAVVPARDEEHRLGPCLARLVNDPAVSEVIVVDDRSSDGTARVAEQAGARVVAGAPLPDGWAGKAWALQQGIEAARGDWVICLDADTRPQRGLAAAAVAAAEGGHVDLLTVGGRFDCSNAGEQFLHPAMLATLVYRFGPPSSQSTPRPSRILANGQCMVVPRGAFLAGGGLKSVAASLIEDVALARHLARRGDRVWFLDGTDVLDVAGYGSARAAWTGWGRSLSMAEVTAPAARLADLAVVWLALAAPLPRVLLGRGDIIDATLLAARLGLLVALRPTYRRRGLAYWLSPLADPAVAYQLTVTTLRPSRQWRGRSYPPAPGGR